MSRPISDPVFDIGRDLQRAYDEGYKQGRYDEKVETETSLPSGEPTHGVRSDTISRADAIEQIQTWAVNLINPKMLSREDAIYILESMPSAQGKPFNLPEIHIADGYDTIEGEDGNVGFGMYVPDENQIYVAGDVEGEIRARALLHEICHWVQAMCGRPFDEDEANEFSDIVYDALPSAQPEQKKGKWINRSLNILYPEWERYTCSVCGKHSYSYDFCPNCGSYNGGESDDKG